jgi:hypothetical protein
MVNHSFPSAIHADLGHYVYIYVDISQDEERIFYVGKGQGNRCFAHLKTEVESDKSTQIDTLRTSGKLRIDLLAFHMNAETALKVEAAAIDLLHKQKLTNKQSGHQSATLGRIPVDDLIARLVPKPLAKFQDDCLLIRINQRYRVGMSPMELYEATRGVWRAGPNREKVQFALAVYQGVVQEVYAVRAWLPAGSTLYGTRSITHEGAEERWEFVGDIAPAEARKRYRYTCVEPYLPNGAQNPIAYFGPSFVK